MKVYVFKAEDLNGKGVKMVSKNYKNNEIFFPDPAGTEVDLPVYHSEEFPEISKNVQCLWITGKNVVSMLTSDPTELDYVVSLHNGDLDLVKRSIEHSKNHRMSVFDRNFEEFVIVPDL